MNTYVVFLIRHNYEFNHSSREGIRLKKETLRVGRLPKRWGITLRVVKYLSKDTQCGGLRPKRVEQGLEFNCKTSG